MNEQQITPQDGLASARRRRMLKIGAGAAPATLLLVGRPVQATTASVCNSVSAWGSVQISATASVAARAATHAVALQTWTLDNWLNNTTPLAGWQPWFKLFPGSTDFNALKTSKTISQAGVTVPSGCAGSDKIHAVLSGTSEYKKLMLVALLNYKVLSPLQSKGYDPSACITSGDLNAMATKTFGVGSGPAWNEAQIVEYLKNNNLARLI